MGPVTPFIPLIAQGAGALFGSLFGSKPSAQMQQAMGPLTQAQNLGLANAQQLLPQGASLLGNAAQSMNPVFNLYSRLLSDRGARTQALAPNINQITQAYGAQQAAQNQLTPRGGGRANLMQQLPYQMGQNILGLFQNAATTAAQGLTGAAGQLGQLGSSLIGGANQSLLASTSAGRDLLNMGYLQQQAGRNFGQQLGLGLGDTLSNTLANQQNQGSDQIPVASPQIPTMGLPSTQPGGATNFPSPSVWGPPQATLPLGTGFGNTQAGYNILGAYGGPQQYSPIGLNPGALGF